MANGTGSDIRASLSLSVSVSLFGFHFSSSALVLLQHRWSAVFNAYSSKPSKH
jgi:hypothetical protein